MRKYYLIDRGPRPEGRLHPTVPWHRWSVCCDKAVAQWHHGDAHDGAWVWENTDEAAQGCGWLLVRWKGLVIDYGHLVRGGKLPDGSPMGFYHRGNERTGYVWEALKGAVWHSSKPLPAWLEKLGVILAPDDWTREEIKRDEDFVAKDKELRSRKWK